MNFLCRRMLQKLIKNGNLRVTTQNEKTYSFGNGLGNLVHLKTHQKNTEIKIALDPMLGFPESYMNGDIDFIEGSIFDLMRIFFQNIGSKNFGSLSPKIFRYIRFFLKRMQQINTPSRAQYNARHHYNIKEELYTLFLDNDMQYSCAFFENSDMSLEEAQDAKKKYISTKLFIKPGQKILDIGSGWGGLGLYMAENFDATVSGITLSEKQKSFSSHRAQDSALNNKVHFKISDYRHIEGKFDRIVSVGMFEHVGIHYYRTFFEKIYTLLEESGVALIHFIGRSGKALETNPFIQKYIFPGGHIPSLTEVFGAINQSKLIPNDLEVWRLHYAKTLEHWRDRFAQNREKAKELYDERFCRMWELYLSASEAAFRWGDLVVFQILLTKKNDVLPITRHYMIPKNNA